MAASAPAELTAKQQPGERLAAGARPHAKALAVALAGCLTLGLLAAQAFAAAPPRPGSPAPAFSLPIVVNGNGALALSSLKGRGVYLNFFASWCGPCKQEVPSIVGLSKEYAHRNVVVIGIDELESADKARQFAAQFHMPYKIVLDDSGDVGGSYGLYGMPLSVFIAPDGTVKAYHVGQMSEAAIRSALQSLITRH